MIRILLVDDHDLVREGIRALLAKDSRLEVAGEAGDGLEAVRLARQLRPDIAILDISLPGGIGGLEVAEAILAELPGTRVLMLTQHEQREYIQRAMRLGVHGYLPKRSVSQQLLEAILTVHQGGRYLHPVAAGELVEMVATGAGMGVEDDHQRLTPRERQVLKLLAEGQTSREIAKYLGVSLKTAMTHRANLMTKLDLHSRSEVVKYALRKGVIEL